VCRNSKSTSSVIEYTQYKTGSGQAVVVVVVTLTVQCSGSVQ